MVLEDLGINMGSMNLTGSLQTALIIGEVAFILFFLGIILFIILRVLSFNVLAVIEEKHEHGTFVYTKRAKIGYDKTDKDKISRVEKIFLIGQRGGMPIMPPTHVIELLREQAKKEGRNIDDLLRGWHKSLYGITRRGKKAIRLVKMGNEFTAVPWSNEDVLGYLRVSKPVRLQWLNNMIKEGDVLFTNQPSFWQQYGAMVMFGGVIIVVAIILIVLFNQLGKLETIAGAINNQVATMNEYVKVLREIAVQPIK